MNDFIEDVQKTCWEITNDLETSVRPWSHLSASKKDGLGLSPCRGKRKEIELDSLGA